MELKNYKSYAMAAPLVIFSCLVAFYLIVFIFSAFAEIYPKWIRVYGHGVFAKTLFIPYVFFAPGGWLLIFSIYALLNHAGKGLLVIGIGSIIYLPVRLLIVSALGSFGFILFVFISAESLIFFLMIKSLDRYNS